ncbi:MAG: Obg family GTPase CgtA, partial [Lachnospiraceae bacterium]|nr:Obg family GTPase CgtA [Lachnospiraceae bacterium]
LPQAIAANKLDALYDEEMDPLKALKDEFESQGIPVFGISAVSGECVNELLYYLFKVLITVDRTPKIFEKEFEVEYMTDRNLPYTVEKNEDGEYVVEGPRIEKMLGYTNLESEKGFNFFQKFLKENGILEALEEAGIEEGDTVRMYGLVFDYYK